MVVHIREWANAPPPPPRRGLLWRQRPAPPAPPTHLDLHELDLTGAGEASQIEADHPAQRRVQVGDQVEVGAAEGSASELCDPPHPPSVAISPIPAARSTCAANNIATD